MRRRRESGPIEPLGNGLFAFRLSADERTTLVGFLDQLEQLLTGADDDPRLHRLFPVAYHQDPEHDAEYQGYMRDELVQSKLNSLQQVRDALLTDDDFTEAQLYAFMTVVNSLRLVLGTLLDVSEDDDLDDLPEDDPSFGQGQLYGYLGWILEWTVWALSGD